MELYKIKPKFIKVIVKLELVRQIYQKLAEKIKNENMADTFRTIASKKKIYSKEIVNLLDFNYEDHEFKVRNQIKVEWEKIRIELNHLILQQDEKVMLEYCIHREHEILNIYQDILEYGSYESLFNTVIRIQMHESVKILNELQHLLEPYEYNQNIK